MKKTNNAKETLTKYLNDRIEQDVTREDIIKDTSISKARLSELIKELRNEGYKIVTPPRSGLVCLQQSEIAVNIQAADVRQWLIIFMLSKYEKCTYVELIQHLLELNDREALGKIRLRGAYTDSQIKSLLEGEEGEADFNFNEVLSPHTLRKDLKLLMDLRYVESGKILDGKGIHDKYWLSESAPTILILREDSDGVCNFLLYAAELETGLAQPLKSVIQKIMTITNCEAKEKTTELLGKSRNIAKEEMDSFNKFLGYPYRDSQLEITYINEGKESHSKIKVGRLFFSTEAGCFYALSKEAGKRGKESLALKKISGIKNAKAVGPNDFWKSSEADRIYQEIFTGSADKSYQVVVLFKDIYNTIDEVKGLQGLRSLSTLEKLDEPIEGYDYVYKDTIRGITNMANYLRGFGDRALVVEPEELRKNMKRTFDNSLKLYEAVEDVNYE